MLTRINAQLSDRELFVGKGTIVDATIINAPSSPKNAENERDPQMHQTRKAKQWYFGMKMHTGVDDGFGLVHTVRATSANVADVNVFGELLHGGEERVHGDSAHHSKELKARAEACGLEFNVTMMQRARNRRLSRMRLDSESPPTALAAR